MVYTRTVPNRNASNIGIVYNFIEIIINRTNKYIIFTPIGLDRNKYLRYKIIYITIHIVILHYVWVNNVLRKIVACYR